MVVNPDKFQSIIINRLGKLKDLLTDNHEIDSENSVTLLGIEIDNKHVTAVRTLENMLQHYDRKAASN